MKMFTDRSTSAVRFLRAGTAACALIAGAAMLSGCGDQSEPAAQLASQTIDVPVYGMDCEGCAATVRRMIQRVDGVVSCEIDLDGNSARVQATDSVQLAALIDAVRAAGFSTEDDGHHHGGHGHDHDHDHEDHDHDHDHDH